MRPANITKEHRHLRQINVGTRGELRDLGVERVGGLLKAGRSFTDIESVPIYVAQYAYGDQITGRRSEAGYFSGLLPPCGYSIKRCELCQKLVRDTEGHRPLILVLSGAIEEFLQFDQVEKRGRKGDVIKERRIPARIAWPGDCLGAYEALNAFYFEDYGKRGNKIFGVPARRLTAGARFVFINAPIKELTRSLRSTGHPRLRSLKRPADSKGG